MAALATLDDENEPPIRLRGKVPEDRNARAARHTRIAWLLLTGSNPLNIRE